MREDCRSMIAVYEMAKKQGKVTPEEADKTIKAFRLLGECEDEDLYALIDTGYFNSIIKAYTRRAMEQAEFSKDDIEMIQNGLKILFDFNTAKEVCE